MQMVSYYTVISGWITTTKQCSPSHSTPTWTVEQSPSTRSRVAPGHPRDREGGQETGTDVGVFPPTLCYMAITPAERQGPVTRRSGRLRGRKRPLSSCFSVCPTPPHTAHDEEERRTGISYSNDGRKSRIVPSYFQFPGAASPPFLH